MCTSVFRRSTIQLVAQVEERQRCAFSVLQKVHENDVITAVNGLRGDAKAMLEEVFAFQRLRLFKWSFGNCSALLLRLDSFVDVQ